MNMNKALQNLYHAVSGSTTTKVNISKLLVDIHYAITGVESSVKNNWSRIIDSMATNWPEGGGGSSDFSTAEVTIVGSDMLTLPIIQEANPEQESPAFLMVARQEIGSGTYNVPLYKGGLLVTLPLNVTVSGDIQDVGMGYFITGDCSITIS